MHSWFLPVPRPQRLGAVLQTGEQWVVRSCLWACQPGCSSALACVEPSTSAGLCGLGVAMLLWVLATLVHPALARPAGRPRRGCPRLAMLRVHHEAVGSQRERLRQDG